MLNYPLIIEDISKYALRPFPDRPEVVLNHLQNVVTRIKLDFQNNFIDTRSRRPYSVTFKGNSGFAALKLNEIEKDVPVICIFGPNILKQYKEKDIFELTYYDEVKQTHRIYTLRTVQTLSFEIYFWGIEYELILEDINHFSNFYNFIEVDGDPSTVFFENLTEIKNYGDFTEYRGGCFKLRLEPVRIWDLYNYEETEPITDSFLKLNRSPNIPMLTEQIF